MKIEKYLLILITFFCLNVKIKAISNITLSEGSLSPYFSESIHKYNVFVSEDIENININAVLSEEDEYASGIGNIVLNNGKNEVLLKVIKKDKSIVNYKINIFKGKTDIADYENATLSNLEIIGHEINFDSSIYEYSVNVEDETSLDINYETTSEYAKVLMTGNSNFNMGENIIKLIVTSKNEENENIYIIKVNKLVSVFNEESKVNEKNILGKDKLTKDETKIITIVIISVCVIFLSLIYFIMFGIKKKN